uniref:Transmembrane protein 67 n=1 Tax=Dicentrarchus labrax TaxID=13489 RepID=A0A8C4E5A3_DICLA
SSQALKCLSCSPQNYKLFPYIPLLFTLVLVPLLLSETPSLSRGDSDSGLMYVLNFSSSINGLLNCQQFIVPYKAPTDCSAEEFFDISSLSCARCGPNQQRSTTGLSCICITGYQTLTTDKGSITCQLCPSDKPAVTTGGFECIRCPGSLTDEGNCKCPQGSVLGEFTLYSIKGMKYSDPLLNPSYTHHSVIHRIYVSSVVVVWLQVFSNLTACQSLGNMCVMNMHSFSGLSTDACGLFNTIFRSRAALISPRVHSKHFGHSFSRRNNLPWLYYGDEPGLASRVLQTDPVPIGFSFRGRNKLLAAVYNVRGEFLRWEPVGGSNLQLCPDTTTKQAAAFSFGTAYQQSCDLSVAKLLDTHPEPLFYDVFMDLGGGENSKLLPLPTLVYNQQYNGRFINQESMKNWYLSRRMFLVDTLSGREKSMSSPPKIIRVASSVKIRWLVPRTQEGQVFPPLMTVTYRDVPIDTQAITFSVEYEMDQNEARAKTDTALGVMGGVAVLYSLLKTVSWKRRIASPLIDVETMLKFLLFYAGDLANVFFAVTVGTGLYWLIFYKAQQFVSVLLPLPAQEEQFVTYIGCAFALKAIQFLHKLILQVSVDIFFIDWERPRSKATTGEPKRDPSPVSIWRTYFVANEWNEIQTIRKISPTFQIMAVLFFLEVLGFSNLALRDPWPTLERSAQVYTPPYSLMLRYGLAATLWLCIGVLQVIFFTVFHEHFVEDKIRQFVDLCSISNISVLLLSHRCFGYYIHGRSVHGHADTNMEEMNNNLKRESESLCGQRGLLPNTEIQTFQVSLTNRLRSQYERIREPLNRRSRPSRLMDASSANQFEQNARAYHTMNHFLGSIIDHAHSDMDYIVKDKLMFERVIGMEFLEPSEKSIFYNDEAHSFSDVLFYGNEATLLIFDTLFFCVVDLGSQSFVLAAVLTYVQQMIFRLIRNALGRRNLVNKTLVDDRFLI